ncbi:MAG: 4-hydroxybenzoate polyprenyltransferase [Gammaproteobacteria bacterium RBG_16_57_12]|nr:MAG: 4-hydroxybenzoate polyprenyltransferase [Gammaproteobacteria bacterium RBG_16_57_12]
MMRLDKPIGLYLLLWPTLWALWVAGEGKPDLLVVMVFVAGVILMRSAGCVINDIADRRFDPHVERTRSRPLAAGVISTRQAVTLFIVLCILAFLPVLLLNRLTILLSLVAAVLAMIYPYMKRHTYLPQVFLGLAFGWAVPMAFAAQTDTVPPVAWLMLVATVLWAVAYDTMYAMVDREDDLKIGIKSTAILFGDADRGMIGILQVSMLLTLLLIGVQLELGRYYYAGVTVAAGLSAYQQYLIKDRELHRCFQAFKNNNWLGATVFAGLMLHYLTR